MLLNPKNAEYGSLLQNSHTKQLVLGVERYYSQDTKMTIEIYNKTYHDTPVYRSDLTEEKFDRYMGFSGEGKGYSNGVELFIQKKYTNNWYTTLSYTNSLSRAKDPRDWKTGYYSRTYDYGQVLTFIGGYKINFRNYIWYNKIRDNIAFRILSFIPILPSDILEFSFRYRYMGGRPYTNRIYEPTYRRWEYVDNWNTERYDHYTRLDLMILRRFNFKRINITTYIDIQNVFDTNNEWEYLYLPNGKKEMAFQYKQLPVGGITIEF